MSKQTVFESAEGDRRAPSMRVESPSEAAACVVHTTTAQRAGDVAAFLGGFTAAEGCFLASETRFRFAVGVGAADRATIMLFSQMLRVGHVYDFPRRKPHYDDESRFVVQSLRDLIEVIVPFMDEHLPDSYKRSQYLDWRARLFDYWEHRAKRRGKCVEDGCNRKARAKQLCRGHYYRAFGR